ncbi:hypothetical protein PR202_gb14012 [Eleusine coracana subsp. coracana]|uniref:F-box domain-containing protein n=1 Tax=Eleusine coracana subsp. coracana TaxID=191504 RepID=A0AAV5ES19_ELECO|nr:hypothetical protein PR202_gb14012 [Eleusine coracana subsp. coracana]
MAMLLRKVWGTVLARAASASGAPEPAASPRRRHAPPLEYHGALSLGALDAVPTDVLAQILRLLGPFDAARCSAVCRAWRVLASDNGLWAFFLSLGPEPWDLVVFAETHLAADPASHPRLYYDCTPQLSFKQIYDLRAVVPGSVIVDGGSGYCKYGWSKYAAPSGRCATFLIELIISMPAGIIMQEFDTESARASRKQYEETLYSVLFDMNVPAVCAVDQAVLALYASKRTSGIVVHIGFNVTSVVPIFQGRVMYEIGVETVGQGALKLTGFLKELMQQRNITYESLYTVRALKEVWLLNVNLADVLWACIKQYLYVWITAIIQKWSVMTTERLEKELHQLLPSYISEGIRVLPPAFGTDSAWFGAKMIGNVSTFTEEWCLKKKQFRQKIRRHGPSFVNMNAW